MNRARCEMRGELASTLPNFSEHLSLTGHELGIEVRSAFSIFRHISGCAACLLVHFLSCWFSRLVHGALLHMGYHLSVLSACRLFWCSHISQRALSATVRLDSSD